MGEAKQRTRGRPNGRREASNHRWDWIWFLFPSFLWDHYPRRLKRIAPPIYVAFLICFAIATLIALVIGVLALTSPSSLNH
jgi:hypothetical protein